MTKIKKNLNMLLIICFFILLNINCNSSKMVLKVKIPKSGSVLQLWEKESSSLGYGKGFKTWVIIKTENSKKKYIIDKHYISFRNIKIFYSENATKIRVETTGKSTPSHSIAIYDIQSKKMLIKSEKTVFKKKDWILLMERKVR